MLFFYDFFLDFRVSEPELEREPPKFLLLHGDPGQLAQVLAALTELTAKFTDVETTVSELAARQAALEGAHITGTGAAAAVLAEPELEPGAEPEPAPMIGGWRRRCSELGVEARTARTAVGGADGANRCGSECTQWATGRPDPLRDQPVPPARAPSASAGGGGPPPRGTSWPPRGTRC